MDKAFYLPNFKKSNLNISSTLAEYLGAPNDKPTLPHLKKELKKNYKNIVFICFDAMGIYPLQKNLRKNNFLRKHIVDTLVSTFPSTTACATTSLLTNTYPMQSGWLGWTMYFENIDDIVTILKAKKSLSKTPIDRTSYPIPHLPYYFDLANTDYETNTVFPDTIYTHTKANSYLFDERNLDGLFEYIKTICAKPNKQFVYAYHTEPDRTMHENGVTHPKTRQYILDISAKLQKLSTQLHDTLLVITSDHGQSDVTGYIELYKDKELQDMLITPPYLDDRATAFRVKEDRKKDFEKLFTQKYGKDFELHRSSELIRRGFFGPTGDYGHLLGDYIAIGTYTHKQILMYPHTKKHKATHSSLTEEMLVPLILITCKK